MKQYDVFISYAIEDKPLAAGIAKQLGRAGLRVYFVGEKLGSGDLISETVNKGLEQSSYCVLLLSKYYIRNWPAIERNHILYREKKAGRKLVFPVWNQITREEVAHAFPELTDHFALSMETGFDQVTQQLIEAIRKTKAQDTARYWRNRIALIAAVVVTLISLYTVAQNRTGTASPIRNTHPIQPDN
jgi:hypothetical protein